VGTVGNARGRGATLKREAADEEWESCNPLVELIKGQFDFQIDLRQDVRNIGNGLAL
jgi:hypothetical protein